MSSQLVSPNREAAIWARLMQARNEELSPAVAEYLLSIRFGEDDREQLRRLAERSESGTLTRDEEVEFDSYLHVGNLLAVLQSKARLGKPGVSQENLAPGPTIAANTAGSLRLVTRCHSMSTTSSRSNMVVRPVSKISPWLACTAIGTRVRTSLDAIRLTEKL